MYQRLKKAAGFSFVEVIIVAAIISLVFGGLFTAFQYSLNLVNASRAKLSAVSLANDRMEFFRSLPYNDVGVVSGFPAGTIPQVSTTSLNNIVFTERVRVDYVDDPADGEGVLDGNLITTDYKQIRLEYTWEYGGVPGSIMMLSNIVPRSIETNVGGGTIRINVIDEFSQLLPGATVRIVNAGEGYDVTALTDVSGAALFSVPAASDFEATVTGPIGGETYSVDGTYVATTTNPNPVSAPFAVLEADVSTLTFQIGQLSDFLLQLRTGVVEDFYIEDFSSLASVASSSAVESTGSTVVLTSTAGVYDSLGVAYLGPITPTPLQSWQAARIAANTPPNTDYRVSFYTGPATGPYVLVPDSDLPGNAAGFTQTVIDLSGLDAGAFPSLIVGVVLETGDTSETPSVTEFALTYRESETEAPGINYSVRGDKIIGTDAATAPIYKYTYSTTTNSDGENLYSNREFDTYTFSFPAIYDVAFGCPGYPFVHQAGVDSEVEFVLVPNEINSLRVITKDTLGNFIPAVTVGLTRPGYLETRTTNGCGQVFFPAETTAQTDYELEVEAAGFQTQTISSVTIDGDISLEVILNPS